MGKISHLIICLCLLIDGCMCANVLILSFFPSASHQRPVQGIARLLVDRGHHITHLAPMRMKDPHENYTFLDISHTIEFLWGKFDFNEDPGLPLSALSNVITGSGEVCENALNSTAVHNLMRRKDLRFDLIMMESFYYTCFHGLVYHFDSPPLITYTTLGGWIPNLKELGNSYNPAVTSDILFHHTNTMSFWERFDSLLHVLKTEYMWNHWLYPKQNELLRRFFGPSVPPVEELVRNVSVHFVCSYWAVDYPRPTYPNVVEVSGSHIQVELEPLSKDLQKFLDEGTDGVVYVNLGCILLSSRLPNHTLSAMLGAFSALNKRVVWKFEAENLPDIPDNVYVGKWFPQQTILAHRNVEVFVFQGGMQSFQEAVYYGVPMLAIPFFADQPHIGVKIEAAGLGRMLSRFNLTTDGILTSLLDVLGNNKYRENVRRLSSMSRMHRLKSQRDVIWWSEFLINHGILAELRPSSCDLPTYQLLLLDVYGLLLLGVVLVLAVLYFTLNSLASVLKKTFYSGKSKQS